MSHTHLPQPFGLSLSKPGRALRAALGQAQGERACLRYVASQEKTPDQPPASETRSSFKGSAGAVTKALNSPQRQAPFCLVRSGTWHVAPILCWALSALARRLGTAPWDAALGAWAAHAVGVATLTSGVLVFFATHGRHPAWCALLVIATLVWWR